MLPRLLVFCMLTCQLSKSLDNGLALTPVMGWLDWERFRCNVDCKNDPQNCISENLFKQMADLMVSEGYKDAGYEYVNIDDCWPAKERDSQGRLVADPERFPSGIKALADYVHAKGLKLGIYEDFGYLTCDGYPGSEFYMQSDANTFAEWTVDMVKFDGCHSDPADMPFGYPVMGKFLNLTGRPMVYMCQWPDYMERHGLKPNYTAVKESCNQWRNFKDVQDSWDSILGIIDYYDEDDGNFSSVAGPGGWNDPDMLIVGDYGLSYDQQKAQFGMWALLSAPLFMSVDLRNIDPMAKQLLQNKNIIAINQDPLGHQATKKSEIPGLVSVWIKKLAKSGTAAIGLLNRDDQGMPTPFKVTLSDLGFSNQNGYQVREAFDNVTMGSYKPSQDFTVNVEPTSLFLMTVYPL